MEKLDTKDIIKIGEDVARYIEDYLEEEYDIIIELESDNPISKAVFSYLKSLSTLH